MSDTRNFRVTINLSNYFHDHRVRARIFVSNDIKTIRDLEERIEKIFHINNFHLTSQNEFLPPTEDVRILQSSDIIWVMPNANHQPVIPKTTPTRTANLENIENKKRSADLIEKCVEHSFHPPKKKKKKAHDVEKSKDEMTNSMSPFKEHSKKKKKYKDDDTIMKGEVDTTTEVEQIAHKDKKKKKKLNSSSGNKEISDTLEKESFSENDNSALKINTLLPVLQLHISSYNKKLSKVKNSDNSSASLNELLETTSTKTEQSDSQPDVEYSKEPYKCKGNLSNYKKKVSVPIVTDKYLQEKKVNIVKIEYLSGGPTHKQADLSQSPNQSPKCTYQSNSIEENGTKLVNSKVEQLSEIDKETCNLKIINTTENTLENTDTCKQTAFNSDEEVEESDTFPRNCDTLPSQKLDVSNVVGAFERNHRIITNESENKEYSDDIEMEDVNSKILNKSITNCMNNKFLEKIESPLNERVKNVSHSLNCGMRNDESEDTNFDTCKDTMTCRNDSLTSPEVIEKEAILNDVSVRFITADVSLKDQSTFYQDNCNISSTMDLKLEKSSKFVTKNFDLQPLQNNAQNKINIRSLNETINDENVTNLTSLDKESVDLLLKEDDNTEPPRINNITTENDILNVNVASESKARSANATIMNESTNLSDCSKYSEIHGDVTAKLDGLSVSASSNRDRRSYSRRKEISGVGQLLGELRCSDSLVTGESAGSDLEEFVTKRRRKRVRRKRKKNNEADSSTSLNDSSIIVTSKYVPKPPLTKGCPSIHLRFQEDGDLLKAVNVAEEKNSRDKLNESCVEASYMESITIDSDAEESSLHNFNINEDIILKSPSIKNSFPRIGDIIAFKILRITENYTPEISSYITGKVLEYNSESKTVFYEILNGLEQCEEPKGILTAEFEDDHINKKKGNKWEFLWSDIIDPRLLFP